MKTNIIKGTAFIVCIFLFLAGCGVSNKSPRRVVPVELNIRSNNNYQLNSINFNVYSYRVLDRLEEFTPVDLTLAEEGDTVGIVLNINIDNYNTWPPEESVSRRTFRRSVAAGTDANGKTVYQTVSASADIVRTRIRANATFNTSLAIQGTPGKNFKRVFSSNINWDNVYVTNVQGDSRALDPGLFSAMGPPIQPTEDEILLALSNREMLDRLSREIRSYYDK